MFFDKIALIDPLILGIKYPKYIWLNSTALSDRLP